MGWERKAFIYEDLRTGKRPLKTNQGTPQLTQRLGVSGHHPPALCLTSSEGLPRVPAGANRKP